MGNKKELVNLNKEMDSMCISIQKFLINYCGIFNEKIHDIKISHQDIKELMPQIKRVSFESLLDDKTDLYLGNVIAVKDCFGNIVPYVNPMFEIDEPLQIYCEKQKQEEIVPEIAFDKRLCIYELAKLCKYFKIHNKLKEYRSTHKLLKEEKGTGVKQYKKRRDNLIMKGRELNEEY